MASVNKHSLREEFDTSKGQFERLCAEDQMAAESRALFQAMVMLFEVLLAVFKVSGCFRTRQYAEAYCRISSYLQPWRTAGKIRWLLYSWRFLVNFMLIGASSYPSTTRPSPGMIPPARWH